MLYQVTELVREQGRNWAELQLTFVWKMQKYKMHKICKIGYPIQFGMREMGGGFSLEVLIELTRAFCKYEKRFL